MRSIARILVLAPVAAIAAAPAGLAAAQERERIVAEVTTADGESAGTVVFEQADHGVIVTANLQNLPAGPHGFHIHENGACAPDFEAAGGHYAPATNEHGYDNPKGYHAGDLPNVDVGADGTAGAEFFVPHLTLAADAPAGAMPFTLRDASGSAIMIHASGDSYLADSMTGARIACGVIAPPAG